MGIKVFDVLFFMIVALIFSIRFHRVDCFYFIIHFCSKQQQQQQIPITIVSKHIHTTCYKYIIYLHMYLYYIRDLYILGQSTVICIELKSKRNNFYNVVCYIRATAIVNTNNLLKKHTNPKRTETTNERKKKTTE